MSDAVADWRVIPADKVTRLPVEVNDGEPFFAGGDIRSEKIQREIEGALRYARFVEKKWESQHPKPQRKDTRAPTLAPDRTAGRLVVSQRAPNWASAAANVSTEASGRKVASSARPSNEDAKAAAASERQMPYSLLLVKVFGVGLVLSAVGFLALSIGFLFEFRSILPASSVVFAIGTCAVALSLLRGQQRIGKPI